MRAEQTAPSRAPWSRDDALWFLDTHVEVKVAQADNVDGLSVLEHRLPFGDAPPVHVHHAEDEVFHILEGEVRFRLGGETRTAARGETVLAPRGVPHGFRVVSPEGARMLTVTRGGFESMVRSVSRPAATPELPAPEPPTPQMQAILSERCAERGIDLLGPPIA